MTYKNAIIVLSMLETHELTHEFIPILAKEKAINALEKQIPKKVVTEKIYTYALTVDRTQKQIVVMICLITD